MKKTWHSLKNRVTTMLLALICILGLLPTAALAAGADTIKLERFTDPTVKMMMAYYYAHSLGIFTDKAHALGVDDIWDSGYSWYMNAWVQAIVWRYKDGSLGDPATACAEELMYVWNSLKGTSYSSIDQTCDCLLYTSPSPRD